MATAVNYSDLRFTYHPTMIVKSHEIDYSPGYFTSSNPTAPQTVNAAGRPISFQLYSCESTDNDPASPLITGFAFANDGTSVDVGGGSCRFFVVKRFTDITGAACVFGTTNCKLAAVFKTNLNTAGAGGAVRRVAVSDNNAYVAVTRLPIADIDIAIRSANDVALDIGSKHVVAQFRPGVVVRGGLKFYLRACNSSGVYSGSPLELAHTNTTGTSFITTTDSLSAFSGSAYKDFVVEYTSQGLSASQRTDVQEAAYLGVATEMGQIDLSAAYGSVIARTEAVGFSANKKMILASIPTAWFSGRSSVSAKAYSDWPAISSVVDSKYVDVGLDAYFGTQDTEQAKQVTLTMNSTMSGAMWFGIVSTVASTTVTSRILGLSLSYSSALSIAWDSTMVDDVLDAKVAGDDTLAVVPYTTNDSTGQRAFHLDQIAGDDRAEFRLGTIVASGGAQAYEIRIREMYVTGESCDADIVKLSPVTDNGSVAPCRWNLSVNPVQSPSDDTFNTRRSVTVTVWSKAERAKTRSLTFTFTLNRILNSGDFTVDSYASGPQFTRFSAPRTYLIGTYKDSDEQEHSDVNPLIALNLTSVAQGLAATPGRTIGFELSGDGAPSITGTLSFLNSQYNVGYISVTRPSEAKTYEYLKVIVPRADGSTYDVTVSIQSIMFQPYASWSEDGGVSMSSSFSPRWVSNKLTFALPASPLSSVTFNSSSAAQVKIAEFSVLNAAAFYSQGLFPAPQLSISNTEDFSYTYSYSETTDYEYGKLEVYAKMSSFYTSASKSFTVMRTGFDSSDDSLTEVVGATYTVNSLSDFRYVTVQDNEYINLNVNNTVDGAVGYCNVNYGSTTNLVDYDTESGTVIVAGVRPTWTPMSSDVVIPALQFTCKLNDVESSGNVYFGSDTGSTEIDRTITGENSVFDVNCSDSVSKNDIVVMSIYPKLTNDSSPNALCCVLQTGSTFALGDLPTAYTKISVMPTNSYTATQLRLCEVDGKYSFPDGIYLEAVFTNRNGTEAILNGWSSAAVASISQQATYLLEAFVNVGGNDYRVVRKNYTASQLSQLSGILSKRLPVKADVTYNTNTTVKKFLKWKLTMNNTEHVDDDEIDSYVEFDCETKIGELNDKLVDTEFPVIPADIENYYEFTIENMSHLVYPVCERTSIALSDSDTKTATCFAGLDETPATMNSIAAESLSAVASGVSPSSLNLVAFNVIKMVTTPTITTIDPAQ